MELATRLLSLMYSSSPLRPAFDHKMIPPRRKEKKEKMKKKKVKQLDK